MFDNDLWLLDFKLILHFYRKNFKHFDFVQETVDEWTAFLVVDGIFHYELDNLCSGEAHEGEMVLCPPGCTFKRRTITMVSLHVMRFELRDSSGVLCRQNKKIPSGAMGFSSKDRYTSTVDLLSKISTDDIYSVNVYKEHLLRDIWLLMCYETTNITYSAGVPDTQDVIMRDILSNIKANVSRKLVMRDIADEFGLNPVVLQRRFKRAFNMTPGAYLARLKLEKAKQLLSDTDKRIIEIAALCGFENEYYFSKAFKRETGLSPTGFRKLV